ncbi:MAG: hypothetical protein Q9184_003435 [Pyrenodesmia sp. 2 TL-2023]
MHILLHITLLLSISLTHSLILPNFRPSLRPSLPLPHNLSTTTTTTTDPSINGQAPTFCKGASPLWRSRYQPLEIADCTTALHRFYMQQVQSHLREDYEFLGPTAVPRFGKWPRVAVTPRKYVHGRAAPQRVRSLVEKRSAHPSPPLLSTLSRRRAPPSPPPLPLIDSFSPHLGTCVLAIAMINFYPSSVLGERGEGPFENNDVARYLTVWSRLHDIIFKCQAPGWGAVGECLTFFIIRDVRGISEKGWEERRGLENEERLGRRVQANLPQTQATKANGERVSGRSYGQGLRRWI